MMPRTPEEWGERMRDVAAELFNAARKLLQDYDNNPGGFLPKETLGALRDAVSKADKKL